MRVVSWMCVCVGSQCMLRIYRRMDEARCGEWRVINDDLKEHEQSSRIRHLTLLRL